MMNNSVTQHASERCMGCALQVCCEPLSCAARTRAKRSSDNPRLTAEWFTLAARMPRRSSKGSEQHCGMFSPAPPALRLRTITTVRSRWYGAPDPNIDLSECLLRGVNQRRLHHQPHGDLMFRQVWRTAKTVRMQAELSTARTFILIDLHVPCKCMLACRLGSVQASFMQV